MNIQKIILDLLENGVIPSQPTKCKPLTGGTVSQLYLLESDEYRYVVKWNDPKVIESEMHFLNTFKESKLLPNLLFVEKSSKYMVYSFLTGSTSYDRKNKQEVLKELVIGLLNHYKVVQSKFDWGFADEPSKSFDEFLFDRIMEANKRIGNWLDVEDYHYVLHLVKKTNRDRTAYLLHGDCGVHNFIFVDGQLSGVIDPTPIIGEPIYDLIYAFCSSPDDLTKETIDSAVNHLMVNNKSNLPYLYEEVVIGLYLRLGTCVKHHPIDFEQYLKAWKYWRSIV